MTEIDLHPLQVAANLLVTAQNDRIVVLAYGQYLKDRDACKACLYEKNRELFESALAQYSIWRMRLNRVNSNRLKYYSYETPPSWGGSLNIGYEIRRADYTLTKFWPCPDCIVKYNPTNRSKERYGNRRRKRGLT